MEKKMMKRAMAWCIAACVVVSLMLSVSAECDFGDDEPLQPDEDWMGCPFGEISGVPMMRDPFRVNFSRDIAGVGYEDRYTSIATQIRHH